MEMPWDAAGSDLGLIVTRITTTDGIEASGFTWTPSVGALAVKTMIVEDCHPLLKGTEVAPPEDVWDDLWSQLRESGSGGITTLAMAAIDIANWDLQGRLSRTSLVDLIGRQRERVPVYASGVNRHLTLDELLAQVERWVSAGYSRFKIKVGLPELDEDVARVSAVRRVIGSDTILMLDANQLWDLPRAFEAMKTLAQFDPYWIEEPLPADDIEAYSQLRSKIDIPIAAGESMYNEYQFRDLLAAEAVDFLQPNCCRVGGITPFLRITALARACDVPVMPHLLPELSAQLAMCFTGPTFVEDIDQAWFRDLGALAEPSGIELDKGDVVASTGPGHGLAFSTGDLTPITPRHTG